MLGVRALLAAFLGMAALAGGAGAVEKRTPAELVCPAPISTCEMRDDGASTCPSGHRCACVPSCPTCRDCAARVCVPELTRPCRTACDCSPGLTCIDAQCVAGTAPVFCCESGRCPVGQQCQHRDGRPDRCGQQCHTACDCEPGLGCFDGQCIAGFAPVFCCEGEQCPAGQQCQHRDGAHDRCGQACVQQAWRCDNPGGPCGDDRVCACSASCLGCEDCGPGVCVPRGTPTPYRCNDAGGCAQPGDRCICVSSCAACDDCALSVCVPSCDPMCERRLRLSSKRVDRVVSLAKQCRVDADCANIETGTSCRSSCGTWVNGRYARRIQRFIDYLDQRYCASYRDDGCPADEPTSCPEERGACIDQQCVGLPATP